MSDFNGFQRTAPTSAEMATDAGLRAFMLGVYNKLSLGLIVAAALAYATGNVPEVRDLLFTVAPDGRVGFTLLGMIVQWSPLVMLFVSMFAMRNPTARGTGLLYWAVVATIGAGLGLVFLIYTGGSIASTFLITAAAFGALSLFGYTTKRNLNAFGSFLVMGLFGLILASIVNVFLNSGPLYFIINVAGVLIFSGLIAYDTQRLKLGYYDVGGSREMMGVLTNWGALNLFLNFVNLFLFLLRLFGSRR